MRFKNHTERNTEHGSHLYIMIRFFNYFFLIFFTLRWKDNCHTYQIIVIGSRENPRKHLQEDCFSRRIFPFKRARAQSCPWQGWHRGVGTQSKLPMLGGTGRLYSAPAAPRGCEEQQSGGNWVAEPRGGNLGYCSLWRFSWDIWGF